jgi:hypothetical protein
MKRTVLTLSVLALLFAVPAHAAIGWYAKWREAPVGLKVNLSALPTSERPHFLAAMNDWNASPVVEMVEGNGGAKVKVEIGTRCGSGCAFPKTTGAGQLTGITLHFNPAIFSWGDQRWVYCHELGHALGLGEGYPSSQTGDYGSCMAGEGQFPSQMDFDVLAGMYG